MYTQMVQRTMEIERQIAKSIKNLPSLKLMYYSVEVNCRRHSVD